MLEVSKKGNYAEWIRYFLKGTIIQSKEAANRAAELEKYSKECREKILDKANINSLKIFDALLGNPYITIPTAKKITKKDYPSAQRAVNKLAEAGILREITGKKRNKIYLAEKIKAILE